VIDAEGFVKKWCGKKAEPEQNDAKKDGKTDVGEQSEDQIPFEWETAYEMKPWVDFPDKPKAPAS